VGDGASDIRLVYGPGYRIYFAFQGKKVILLLCGMTNSLMQSIYYAAAKHNRRRTLEKFRE
jgi:putative addiction module killer protein